MQAIIFCDIQASGKSTFYQQNFFNSHIRISLDLLNTRHKEQKFLALCIELQAKFVVDNTNPRLEDRKKYIDLAKQANFEVIGYYFQSKIQESIQRNNQRLGKAKISEKGILGTYNQLEMPSLQEGFDKLYFVKMTENQGFIVENWQNEI